MKRRSIRKQIAGFALAAALAVTQLGGVVQPEYVMAETTGTWADTELVVNGDFENSSESWNLNPIPSEENSWVGAQIKTDQYAKNNKTNMLNINNSSSDAAEVSVSQKIENVAAGTYRLAFKQEGKEATSGLTISVNEVKLTQTATKGWDVWETVQTESFTLKEAGDVTISIAGNINAGYWGDFDDLVLQSFTETASGGEATQESYSVSITPSTAIYEAGTPFTLTATVKKGEEEITDLESAGLHLWWWNNTTNSAENFVGYDSTNGYDLSINVNESQLGAHEIQAKLQDAAWHDLYTQKYSVTVAEPANIVEGDLNITKVGNLSEDFIMGMDISSVISEFASGVTYKDYEGKTIDNVTDFCKFLATNGITHIRVRVWNDPYDANGHGYGGGNNDVAKAKQIADACRAAGIKMLVDFHCSDLWTDPGKQQAPKAWKGYTLAKKETALKAYITDSLNEIDAAKDTVAMVQVGNETTSGFVGETDTTKMCTLFSAGASGVRAYNSNVKVVIHETNPEKGNVTKWAKLLNDNKVDYDILATSYYPYWHGTFDNLKSEFKKVKDTYRKDVMVAETSYAYTLNDSDGHANTVRVGNNDNSKNATEPFTEQGQGTAIRNLINAVNEVGGLGVFYWEPAWLTVGDITGLSGSDLDNQIAKNKTKWEQYGSGWASSYAAEYDAKDAGTWFGGTAVDNEAMFYPDGTPTPGLHVWNYVKTGAVNKEVNIDSVGTSEELNETIKIGESNHLPETITISYTSGAVAETVKWNESDVSKIKLDKTGTYKVSGTVAFSKKITQGAYKGLSSADVLYTLTVLPANLIDKEDADFNKGTNYTAEGAALKAIPSTENPYSGKNSMSWWSKAADTATVTYNKEFALEKGKYTFEAMAEGSEGEYVTLQVLSTDGKVLFEGTPTGLAGWNNWQKPEVKFTVNEDMTVKVRVSLTIAAGGWGSADCLYLYKTGEITSGGSAGGSSTGTTTPTVPEEEKPDKNTEVTTNPDGSTTEKIVIAEIATGTTATVKVVKNEAGEVQTAKADVTKVITKGNKAVLSGAVVDQLQDAAGQSDLTVTMTVKDSEGKTKYSVQADTEDLVAGNKLYLYEINAKTGKLVMVNAKTYKVSKAGSVSVSSTQKAAYQLVSADEAKTINKAILKTVEPKKTSATVKKGKKTALSLSSKLDKDNVKTITYVSSKKSVATVSKNGKITAKKAGTAVVKAKVTLKNGSTKTVTMKIKVK